MTATRRGFVRFSNKEGTRALDIGRLRLLWRAQRLPFAKDDLLWALVFDGGIRWKKKGYAPPPDQHDAHVMAYNRYLGVALATGKAKVVFVG